MFRIHKLVLLFVFTLLLFSPLSASAKYASMVIDADSGRVLHATNADTRNYPASLTKIMTLYMVFDALKKGELALDTPLKVSKRAEGMPPSKLGLRRGKTITVRDAILALVTKSANDAAVVVAEALGGTEIAFARDMTTRARQLGMSRTTFRNASGLPNRRQLSTARDMALLGLRIREDFPDYYTYFSTTHFKFGKRNYKNHNTLLSNYKGTDGIKTGYIRASGFNLVASVERDGYRLVGVVFGGKSGKSRDRHMRKLLDKGFAMMRESGPAAPQLLANAGSETPLPQGDAVSDQATSAMGGWTIQVGAFSRASAARGVAQDAVGQLGDLGEDKLIVVDPAGTLHRSRVAGFEKSEAYAACRHLKAKRMDCIVFAPRG